MENLLGYSLDEALTNHNAGYSMWGFARKDGKDFFIKQFLSPKYPYNDTVSSPERIEKRKNQCRAFADQKIAVYSALNQNSDGNDVRVFDFFRVQSRYYIAMPKIEALPWTIETIAALPLNQKKRLCMLIAHAIAGLHKGGLVHADLKHDNILYTETANGCVTAKIIDFDSGFLETDPPANGEEIVGDFHYFSPEAHKRMRGEEAELTCKMDVFALGVLFHQYFSGSLPGFDHSRSTCPGEAALDGLPLEISEDIPEDMAELLKNMLAADPAERLSAQQVYEALREQPEEAPQPEIPDAEPYRCEESPVEKPIAPAVAETIAPEKIFYTPGPLL